MIKYPEIELQLSGEDGNAFFIIGRLMKALKRAGVPEAERAKVKERIQKAPDYDGVLLVVMQTVTVK